MTTDPTLDALRRGDLHGARTLRLRGLTEFPREILGLADSLEILDLSDNPLSALPDDLGRLHRLRALFCSNSRFDTLPPSLGDCASLSQVGFRNTGLRDIPADSLPPSLRWLTVTDNRLRHLPSSLGARPRLQKLMLSGNRLTSLPPSLQAAGSIELLRLSANRFDALPDWLHTLPRLAWLAWAGNPFEPARLADAAPVVAWDRLTLTGLLGEGASGLVHRALWQPDSGPERPVAIKLFRGAMTSDGLPEREMEACLAAGDHPNLAGGLGRLHGHPEGRAGLAMRLLPDGWRVLAGPPSLESCTRDIYPDATRLAAAAVLRLVADIAAAGAHLHANGLSHGDLYAHNVLWDGTDGQAVLGDFGASAFLPDDPARCRFLRRIDVLAWAILLGELLDRCVDALPAELHVLHRACLAPEPNARPGFAELRDALGAIRSAA